MNKQQLRAAAVAYYAKMDRIIKSKGWMVQSVLGTETEPGFSYTIGMLPTIGYEMLVFALPPGLAGNVLNDLVADVKQHKQFEIGPEAKLDTSRWFQGNMPIRPVWCNIDNPMVFDEYVRQACQYHHRPKFPVVQLLLCDAKGVLPNEPGFDHAYMDVRQPRLDL